MYLIELTNSRLYYCFKSVRSPLLVLLIKYLWTEFLKVFLCYKVEVVGNTLDPSSRLLKAVTG